MSDPFARPGDDDYARWLRHWMAAEAAGDADGMAALEAELAARGIRLGRAEPIAQFDCAQCGITREVDVFVLGWLSFCDVCGNGLASADGAATRWMRRRFKRWEAPFDPQSGDVGLVMLSFRLAASDGRPRALPTTSPRRLFVAASPPEGITLVGLNKGGVPFPAGYLTREVDPSAPRGPRPLIAPGDEITLRLAAPEAEERLCVHLIPPAKKPHMLADVYLTPLRDVQWRVADCEPDHWMRQSAHPDLEPRGSRFTLEVAFAGDAPSPRFASGHLRLPDASWPLELRTPRSSASHHVWTTAIDVTIPARAEFEIRLEYLDLVGHLRLRGTLHGINSHDRATTEMISMPPLETLRWVALDATPAGLAMGGLDEPLVASDPPRSIRHIADALQLFAPSWEAAGEIGGDVLTHALGAGTLGDLQPAAFARVEQAAMRLDDSDGIDDLDRPLAAVRSALARRLEESAHAGAPAALLTSAALGTDAARRLRAQLGASALDLDRATSLVVDHLREGLAGGRAIGSNRDILVIDMGSLWSTLTLHCVASPTSGRSAAGGVTVSMLAQLVVGAGFVDVIDHLTARMMHPRPSARDRGAIEASKPPSDSADLWLFSPARRETRLQHDARPTAVRGERGRGGEPPLDGDPQAGAGSLAPASRMALRLLTACALYGGRDALEDIDQLLPVIEATLALAPMPGATDIDDLLLAATRRQQLLVRESGVCLRRHLTPIRDDLRSVLASNAASPREVLVSGPAPLQDMLAIEARRLCHGVVRVEPVAPRDGGTPSLRGALLCIEAMRPGFAGLELTLAPRPVFNPLTVQCSAPERRLLIPAGCSLLHAIGHIEANPADASGLTVCLHVRPYGFVDGARQIEWSLASLELVDGGTLKGRHQRSGPALFIRIAVCLDPAGDTLQLVGDVIEVDGDAATRASLRRRRGGEGAGPLTDPKAFRSVLATPIELMACALADIRRPRLVIGAHPTIRADAATPG